MQSDTRLGGVGRPAMRRPTTSGVEVRNSDLSESDLQINGVDTRLVGVEKAATDS